MSNATQLTTFLLLLCASACATEQGSGDPICEGEACKGEKADDGTEHGSIFSCPDREPEVRDAVRALLNDLDSGARTDITNVDQLIAALPENVRENVLFLTDTRSMARIYPQEEKERMIASPTDSDDYSFHDQDGRWCSTANDNTSCVESRVLFTSREGDFIGSFTTHPNSPAANRFEMMLFDSTVSELNLFDIAFENGIPKVTKNPKACMQCHEGNDGSVNYRMDPYRFWSYMTPFNEDLLRENSVETDWYMSFLDRIESGEKKLGQLRPFNSQSDLMEELGRTGSAQLKAPAAAVDFAGIDTPSLNLSHQLLEKNACRVAVNMAKRDDFDKIKYAAVGALIDCDNTNDFFPAQGSFTRANAEDYFTAMGEGQENGFFDYDTFEAEVHQRQAELLSDKLSRRYAHYAEFMGNDKALEEIQGAMQDGPVQNSFGVTNFEKYGDAITKARYLLEPLGVDVTQWSMAVDRVAQSHVEFLHPLAMQPVFIDFLLDEIAGDGLRLSMDIFDCQNLDTRGPQGQAGSCYSELQQASGICERLAEKSREALANHVVAPAFAADYFVEEIEALEQAAADLAASSTLEELSEKVSGTYQVCSACHVFAYSTGSPSFPFGDMNQLGELFRRDSTVSLHQLDGNMVGINRGFGRPHQFKYISSSDRIWDRVTRHPRQHGAMPRTKIPLTETQKIELRAHMLKAIEN